MDQKIYYDRINYRKGDLLAVKDGYIVHGCNAQGVMGAGVAKAVIEKYPECFKTYQSDVQSGSVKLGENSWRYVGNNLYIVSAITQQFYGVGKRQVNYAALVTCFQQVFKNCYDDTEVHFPKIGSGLGGGDWNIIEQLILDCDPNNRIVKFCWEL